VNNPNVKRITLHDTNNLKWVAIGNSIAWHPINSYWWGEYGMAASKRENGFVHVLNDKLKGIDPNASFKIAWSVDWERNHSGYDLSYFDEYFDGNESLVVIRLGENVTSLTNYESDLRLLVKHIKSLAPNAQIVISGVFMTASANLTAKDTAQKNVADSENCVWLSLKELDTTENRSKVGNQVMGDDGQLYSIDNPTVADYPGDKGMEAIADAIYNLIDF
jgi:hypothetical protein